MKSDLASKAKNKGGQRVDKPNFPHFRAIRMVDSHEFYKGKFYYL